MLILFLLSLCNAEYSFLSVGDWGGKAKAPYYTPGQLTCGQVGMPKIAEKLNAKLVLAVGDNFYDSGIPTDEFDPRFTETFEDVYADDSLEVPWYAIAGNHDHRGNVTAQIFYSNHSSRWNYPSEYYDFVVRFKDGGQHLTAHFIMIDTVVFAGDSYVDDEGVFHAAPGPENVYEAQSQLEWLENILSTTKADFVWVAGHYPVWSVCSHGPTAHLDTDVKPLLEKYNVTGYIAGHDHCQSFVRESETGPVYPLAGNSHDCCYEPSKYDKNPKNSVKYYLAADNKNGVQAGFASYTMSSTEVVIAFYDENGVPLYSSSKAIRNV